MIGVRRNNNRGFSVVELTVAMGLFVTVMSIALGGLAHALKRQRQISGLIAANSNASLTVEQIVREIRTASDFCGATLRSGTGNTTCVLPNLATAPVYYLSELVFRNARGDDVAIRLNAGKIERRQINASGADSGWLPITADNVVVDRLRFYTPAYERFHPFIGPARLHVPRFLVAIAVRPQDSSIPGGTMYLQMTVSARIL